MSIVPELLHFCSPRHPPAHSQELRLSGSERVESSSRSSFIPPQIKDYGLGIPACLANFCEDMGERPEGRQIDRIDNNKGYSLDNCRWATSKQNGNNQERSVRLQFGYLELTIAELADLTMVPYGTICQRRHRNGNDWSSMLPPDQHLPLNQFSTLVERNS